MIWYFEKTHAAKRKISHLPRYTRDKLLITNRIVLAITKSNIAAPPTLFKTYSITSVVKECKIWEIVRATSAATTFFKSIACGRDKTQFIDAGLGYNNPCRVLLQEARRVFPDRKPEDFVVLSIGTGRKHNTAILGSRISMFLGLKDCATSSTRVANEMEDDFQNSGRYHRFDVARGLENVGLADWKKNGEISTHTHNYMNE